MNELHEKIKRMRRNILTMAHEGKTSHVGSALSCVEILTALYFKVMAVSPKNWETPQADRFILSKGHGVMAWYAVLAEAGFLKPEELKTYAADGSHLGEHPSHTTGHGIGFSTGSLGHGLAVAAGHALARKMDGHKGRVFVLISDGECNEGSIWEAAMCAAQQKLDNLTVLIDDNHMQAMGPSRAISALDPLKDKWAAFGFDAVECDGHDVDLLAKVCRDFNPTNGRPKVVIAHTCLAKGVSFMEDDILWHYQIPSKVDMAKAFEELERA